VVKSFNRLRRTFDAIDDDESGEIERKEFRKLIKRLAPQMSTEEGDEVFNSIDVPTPGISFRSINSPCLGLFMTHVFPVG